MKDEQTEKQSRCFLAAALLATLAHSAAYCSWPMVLILGGACLTATYWLGRWAGEPGRVLRYLQGLWTCVIAAAVLGWISAYWPDHRESWAAPLILLALAAWAAGTGKSRAAQAGCVLLYPIAIVLGVVLLSALPEVRPWRLRPQLRMTGAEIVPIFLLPALERGGGKGKANAVLLGFAGAVSAVTAGVLSFGVGAGASAPVCELSRSLSLLGTGLRFEALVSAAMTLGFFAVLSYLLGKPEEGAGAAGPVWAKAGLTALLYLSGIPLRGEGMELGALLLFVLLPALETLKNMSRKRKKGVDKEGGVC